MTWRHLKGRDDKREEKRPEAEARAGFSWGRAAFRSFLFLALVLARQAVLFLFIWLSWEFALDAVLNFNLKGIPSIEEMRSYRPMKTTVLYDAEGRPFARFFIEDRVEASLLDISPWLPRAVIAAEDSRFLAHGGVSPVSIARAAIENRRAGGVRQGGSTITQQLARNMFLTNERTVERKLREAVIAFRLESAFSKAEILEKYLNEIYFGRGAWGAETASRVYFGKSARDLSLGEAALLAGLIPSPNRLNPGASPEAAEGGKRRVLARMLDTGAISAEEFREASLPTAVVAAPANDPAAQVAHPYYSMRILNATLLPEYGTRGAYGGGLHVYTALDPRLQEAAEKVAAKSRLQLAIAAMDPETGEVKALVGGRAWDESQFNRAVQAYRQPGSAFKPIVYAALFEMKGWGPRSGIDDSPLTVGKGRDAWSPQNYDRKYRGRVTVETALVSSLNVPAARAFLAAGRGSVFKIARDLGITTPYLPEGPAMALGAASLTPLEMATAFSAFANGGYRVYPHLVREIRDDHGNVLFKDGSDRRRVLSEQTAGEIRDILVKAVDRGTGTAARIKGYEVFGKTGTTNDFRDAWFIGGFPGLCTAVYVGHDDRRPIAKGATGGKYAAPVWCEFMKEAAAILSPAAAFPKYAVTRRAVVQDDDDILDAAPSIGPSPDAPPATRAPEAPKPPRPAPSPWPGQEKKPSKQPMIVESETESKFNELLKRYNIESD